jgi:Zn-dependent peptidase ImmA (M78 family)
MAIEYIIDAVAFLKQEYGDISPMALAHSKGILVDAQHYGNIQESFRGFAIQLHGKLHITLNLDQDEVMQQVCLAHELGHCILHPYSADARSFTSLSLDNTSTTEYEASLFAAECSRRVFHPCCWENQTIRKVVYFRRTIWFRMGIRTKPE